MDLRRISLGSPRPPFVAALACSLVLAGMAALDNLGYFMGPVRVVQPAAVLPGAVIALTNDERADNDLGSLRANELLNRAAQLKANDMAEKSYYAHVSPDGTIPPKWLDKVGYKYQIMAENLVVDRESSDAVVSAWMGSSDHRHNILNPTFTEIGVGVAYGTYKGRDTIYVVQLFARPLNEPAKTSTPKPKPAPKPEPKPVVTPVTTVTVSVPTPAPKPKPVIEPAVLVRAPEVKPVVRNTIAPILEAVASTTLAEVPSIVASTSYMPPALASESGKPVELAAAAPKPEAPKPSARIKMRAFVNAVGSQIKSFFEI